MAKTLLTDYAFTPGAANAGTITVPGEYALEQFLLITNVTAGVVIYQFNAPSKGAALSIASGDTTLTLEANTAAMSSGDSLQIFADSGAGASARTVLSGSGAPGAGTGADGDFYIDTADTEIYGPKASGAWGSGTSLVGPAGATGATGATGSTGATGPSGVAAATAPLTYNSGTQTVAITAATTSAAGSMSATDKAKLDGVATGATANSSDATLLARANHTGTQAFSTITGVKVEIGIACSDETTNLTTGTAKVTLRMPHAMTLTAVRLNCNTAPTGSALVVNVLQGGSTIFSTKPQIDSGARTSVGSGTAAVISTSALTDDAEITINIDQIGSTIAGKGLKVWFIGTRA